jgi:hypothetical protein
MVHLAGCVAYHGAANYTGLYSALLAVTLLLPVIVTRNPLKRDGLLKAEQPKYVDWWFV